VWVNVSSIANGTVVRSCYDNASVSTSQTTPTSTWDSSTWQAVWHLPEDPSGTAPQFNDSTGNGNHGTTVGSWTSGEQVSGQVDGSVLPNGSTQYATIANATNFDFERSDSWSTVGWYKVGTNSLPGALMAKMQNSSNFMGWAVFLRQGATNPQVAFQLANNANSNTNTLNTHTTSEPSQNAWHMFGTTYDGTSNTSGALIYIDGASAAKTDAANNLNATIKTSVGPELLARDTTPGIPGKANVDELRVTKTGVVLSSAFMSAFYNNTSAPNTFFSLSFGNPVVPVPVGQGARIMENQ
jgi:hypothetical protein